MRELAAKTRDACCHLPAERRGRQPAMSSGTAASSSSTLVAARGTGRATPASLHHPLWSQQLAKGRVPASTLPEACLSIATGTEHVEAYNFSSAVLGVHTVRQGANLAVLPQGPSARLLPVMPVACVAYGTKMKLLCQDVAYVPPIL